MGSYLSTSETPTLTDAQVKFQKELQAAIPYICGNVKGPLKVDPTVKLELRNSNLPTAFLQGRHEGLFAVNAIPKGTIISKVDMIKKSKMNDGMVNLEAIFRASNSEEMYLAWKDLEKGYYDIEKMKSVINVRMVSDSENNCYYEALQDIPTDTELVRVYGFTSWPFEILDIFTNKTMVGFAHFIKELAENVSGDPFEVRIKRLRNDLASCEIPNIYSLDRTTYDIEVKDKLTMYMQLITAKNWANNIRSDLSTD